MKTSVSLIKQFALVGQQHEAFDLQGRVVDIAHVGQAHPCFTSRTAEYSQYYHTEISSARSNATTTTPQCQPKKDAKHRSVK